MSYLYDLFAHFRGGSASSREDEATRQTCHGSVVQAVDYVVDATEPRLRAISAYARRLKGPVAEAFGYIDGLTETVPGVYECSRSAFSDDPRINAFFVDPRQMQELFSRSKEVGELFDANPTLEECCVLLCMRMEESNGFGCELIGDEVRRDVAQTTVSFFDHRLVSPGCNEEQARRALQCCIFNGLLDYIRQTATAAKGRGAKLESRLKGLRADLRHAGGGKEASADRSELLDQIAALEAELAQEQLRLRTPEEHLGFVADVLGNPAQYLTSGERSLRLSRTGIKLEGESSRPGYELRLSEIKIAGNEPRIGALVSFPRRELLPEQSFLEQADLFLTGTKTARSRAAW